MTVIIHTTENELDPTTTTPAPAPGSLTDEKNGFPLLIAKFQNMDRRQQEQERRFLVKASFDRLFGQNARRELTVLEGVISAQLLKNMI